MRAASRAASWRACLPSRAARRSTRCTASSAFVSPRESPSTSRPERLIVTCEHGGNRVPARYRRLLTGAARALASHQGYDRGALALARALARRLDAPLLAATTTRLLADHNRSATHPDCFSRYTRDLPDCDKARLLAELYWPHRRAVERAVARQVRAGRCVLHVAVHSFTPVLRGERRKADLGLLYDPARRGERALCARWTRELEALDARLRVRHNYPYLGTSDGLTTALRAAHPARLYVGIELELSQGLLARPSGRRRAERALQAVLAGALRTAEAR